MNRLVKSGRGKHWAQPLPHSLHNKPDSHAQALASVATFRRLGMTSNARAWLNIAKAIRRDEMRLNVHWVQCRLT